MRGRSSSSARSEVIDAQIQTGSVADEEGHHRRGGVLGRDDEVALVLAVLIVDDHDYLPGRDSGSGLLDGGDGHGLNLPCPRQGAVWRFDARLQEPLGVLSWRTIVLDLQVHPVARAFVSEGGDFEGVRDHGHRKRVGAYRHHSQADPVDCHGAFLHPW